MSQSTPHRQLRTIVKTLERLATETVDQSHAGALLRHASLLSVLSEAMTPTSPPNALTPAQARVLYYVQQFIAEFGAAPTRKEICHALSFSSPNAAQDHLKALVRKGRITLTGESRGIVVNQPHQVSSGSANV